MNKVLKTIGGALVDIAIALLVILSIIISISSITARANNGVPDLFGYSPFSVQTDSMQPLFSKGDYIFVEKCEFEDLVVGDVITYFTIIDGQRAVNTHRLIDIVDNNGMIQLQTQGDNRQTNPEPDRELLSPGDVIGKYSGKMIPMLGAVIDYLSTQIGFFLVIMLPVLLFTIFQIYKLFSVIMYNKKVDMVNAANENTSEEVKAAIIAEYLAKQKNEEAAKEKDE